MRIALFTDTFAPEVNGAAKTLYQFTQYVKSKQIPIQVFAPEFAHDQSFSTYVHRSPSMPFFLYPNSRFSLPNVLKLKSSCRNSILLLFIWPLLLQWGFAAPITGKD